MEIIVMQTKVNYKHLIINIKYSKLNIAKRYSSYLLIQCEKDSTFELPYLFTKSEGINNYN